MAHSGRAPYSRFDQHNRIVVSTDRCCLHRLGILVLETVLRAMSNFRVSWRRGYPRGSGERRPEQWSNIVLFAVPVVAAIAAIT